MSAADAEAAKNNWPVVVAIIDSGGHIVMLHRRDNAQLASIEIAQGKAKTALKFKRPTKVLDDAISGGGAGVRFLALKDITPLEGGFPLDRSTARSSARSACPACCRARIRRSPAPRSMR